MPNIKPLGGIRTITILDDAFIVDEGVCLVRDCRGKAGIKSGRFSRFCVPCAKFLEEGENNDSQAILNVYEWVGNRLVRGTVMVKKTYENNS